MLLEILHKTYEVKEAFGPLLAAGLMGAANFISGAIRKGKADREIQNLEKHKPNGYGITPELQRAYDDALANKNKGFSQDERANFTQEMARQNLASYNKALAYGGNTLAGAIRAGINSNNVMALNRFAANDAAIKRQNIMHSDALAGDMTRQRNLDTTRNLQDYDRQMAAYGQSSRDARLTQENALNFFGSVAGAYAGMPKGTNSANGNPADQFSGYNISEGPTNNTMQPMDWNSLASSQARLGPVYDTSSGGTDWANNPYNYPRDNSEYSLYQSQGPTRSNGVPMESYATDNNYFGNNSENYDNYSFGGAFSRARRSGLGRFSWRGKPYTTELK